MKSNKDNNAQEGQIKNTKNSSKTLLHRSTAANTICCIVERTIKGPENVDNRRFPFFF